MRKYKSYLIDLDGTMYIGKNKIEAASDFVKALKKHKIPYLFVTNNSSRTPAQVAKKLQDFDIPATEELVFTTSMATANYIYEQNQNATIYCIGENGLQEAIREKGFAINEDNPDYVIVGLDREVTYEKLAKACLAVRNGATFISTNGDIALPTERGFLPGNGAITSVVAVSTRKTPIFIGKPEKIIIEQALKIIGTKKEDTIMVGDNYDTDILAGIRAGLDTLLVHTGVTTKEQLSEQRGQPTYTINTLDEWRF